jgi:hypothetical protein
VVFLRLRVCSPKLSIFKLNLVIEGLYIIFILD